jgi:hypothetical protein
MLSALTAQRFIQVSSANSAGLNLAKISGDEMRRRLKQVAAVGPTAA